MTVDPLPPVPAAPAPSTRDGGPEGRSWAHDLVETAPAELRRRRLRRIAVAAGGALAVVALVAAIVVNLRDPGSDVVVNDGFAPHDAVLSSYMVAAPADAQPAPAGRDLDETAAAEATGGVKNLRRYKFSYGYERRWTQRDGTAVTVLLLRFPRRRERRVLRAGHPRRQRSGAGRTASGGGRDRGRPLDHPAGARRRRGRHVPRRQRGGRR
ncbi:hypothetical protein GCM10020358_35440 [Amorphoplanes nipponensis]|uniref:hypothetical protein n=1 Tax=Actinoplanes nipponensis TaxID=135950 RepID=UPI0031ECE19F